MCRVLRVQRSGFYAWLRAPVSLRAREDMRLLALIRKLFVASGGTYGSPWIHRDLRELGEPCSVHRVARLMRQAGLRAQIGYTRRWIAHGRPARVAPNRLNRVFTADAPNQVWVGDITYVRTHEGFLYLAVVLDLFSRLVVGWSMQPTLSRDLVMQALLAIVVARRLRSLDVLETLAELFVTHRVPAHLRSDNGPEFTAALVRHWLAALNVETLFIEPGSPWENGYVESFNGKLRDELLDREIFYTLTEAKILIERWRREYNTVRPHSALDYRPPAPEAISPAGLSSMIMRPALS
jgi:putative transposase